MSADRYEITVDGPCVTIKEPCGFSGEYHRSEYADNVLYGALRQQARDIAELRTENAAILAENRDMQMHFDAMQDDLAAAVAERDRMAQRIKDLDAECSVIAKDCTYAEQQNDTLRARLAAIDAAPAVAVVCGTPDGFTKWILWLPYAKDATPIDVDLIARPAKDSKSTFEETARSIGIRFNDIENHENQT